MEFWKKKNWESSMLPSISHPGGALQSSIPYAMPLTAQLSGALSSKPQCLHRKRTPVTFRPKNELSIQLGATLGRVCGSTLSAAIIPLKDALCACSWMGPLQLGCAQDILLDVSMFYWGHTSRGWAAWTHTQTYHILFPSQTGWSWL